jgi:hypothetical protein
MHFKTSTNFWLVVTRLLCTNLGFVFVLATAASKKSLLSVGVTLMQMFVAMHLTRVVNKHVVKRMSIRSSQSARAMSARTSVALNLVVRTRASLLPNLAAKMSAAGKSHSVSKTR